MIDPKTRALVQGIIWGIVFAGFLLVIMQMIFSDPTESEEKFKVVDRYENCNIIRYTDASNRYQYFLQCP